MAGAATHIRRSPVAARSRPCLARGSAPTRWEPPPGLPFFWAELQTSLERGCYVIDSGPPPLDFIAVDVETANADLASVCAIGLVSFRGGEELHRVHFLVNPEDEFDEINIAIHGITPERVANAPRMHDVFPIMSRNLIGNIVVHHTHFDRVALYRAAERCGAATLGCNWIDTACVARRAWQQFAEGGYGLANIAQEFGIPFRHHDAAEDARVAGLIMLRATETGDHSKRLVDEG